MSKRDADRRKLETLRCLSWLAVWAAVLMAGNGSTAAGGPQLGLALAAALALVLRATRPAVPKRATTTARGTRS